MTEYKKGNMTILQMIRNASFDEAVADELLSGADLNEPICNENGFSTTYLYEAVSANNLQAVKYLLEHGADPNFNNLDLTCDCPLWMLQYIEKGQLVKERYEIEKLFFKHGANPNLIYEDEGLYDYVLYKIYNDSPGSQSDWENLIQFYKLLVLFGGGGLEHGYAKPDIDGIDASKADDYHIELFKCDDGYHLGGHLVDKDGAVLAEL